MHVNKPADAAMAAVATRAGDRIAAGNREIVLDFLEKAINQADFEEAQIHFGPRYVQHNPMIGDGVEGIRKHMVGLREQFPQLRVEVKRVVAEGGLVVAHVHAMRTPDDPGLAIVDIFRLEAGKIVEHWEVRQPVPETAALHGNGMF